MLTAGYFPDVAALDHRHTIMHAGLAKNTIEMILDSSFRQSEPRRNFFVSQAEYEQSHQLLFPPTECLRMEASDFRSGRELFGRALKERPRKTGWANCLTRTDRPDNVHDIQSGGVLQHVSHHPVAHRAQKSRLVALHSDHDHFRRREHSSDGRNQPRAMERESRRVEQNHFGCACHHLVKRLRGKRDRSDYGHIYSFGQDPN